MACDSLPVRLARDWGWRAYAIPVLLIVTAWVLVDVVINHDDDSTSTSADGHGADSAAESHHDHRGPNPATMTPEQIAQAALPEGAPYTEAGDGTYRVVGEPGLAVGEGADKVVRYVVELENGIDSAVFGGDDAVASQIDATLSNPKSWTADPAFRFEHVGADENPDLRIQLTSSKSTEETCGNNLDMETSCFYAAGEDGQRVVINEARWVRGAGPFAGDLGSYRQYVVNHEVGHAIGYADHEPCGADGELAPVMMQQTLSLNNAELHGFNPEEIYPDVDETCRYNPWPYPRDTP